jgi:uncharacterized protein
MLDSFRSGTVPMKFNLEQSPGSLTIAAYARGWIRVRDTRIDAPCVITRDTIYADLLPAAPAALTSAHVDGLIALAPEIVLLGTGERQCFVAHELAQAFARAGVGFEVMDTGAACRSFNILVSEDRAVAAALFMI